MKIISCVIDGLSTICGVTLDMIVGERKFDYLFKMIKLQNLDGHRPILRKVVEGTSYTAYLFAIPTGLSIDDFEDNKSSIAQYLHRKEDEVNIELVNSQALITIKDDNKNVSFNYEDYEYDINKGIPLGLNLYTHKITYWDFKSSPHVILGGSTNSGKSTMLNVIMSYIANSLSDQIDLYLQDTKIVDLYQYQDLDCVKYYEEYKDGIYELLSALVEEMSDRYKFLKKNKSKDIIKYNENHPNNKIKYKILIIEELSSFSIEDSEDKEHFYPKLKELLNKGRAAGYQVWFTCQTPYNTTFPGVIKNNVTTVIGLRCLTGEASKSICGDFDALTKLKGKGHAKLFSSDGSEEFQGFNIQDETIENIVSGNKKVVEEIESESKICIGIKRGGFENEK